MACAAVRCAAAPPHIVAACAPLTAPAFALISVIAVARVARIAQVVRIAIADVARAAAGVAWVAKLALPSPLAALL